MPRTPGDGDPADDPDETHLDRSAEVGHAHTLHTPDPDATHLSPATKPTRRSPDLVPGTMVGEYKIEGKLGEGGMGTVYAATHPLIGKRAAIKVLKPELCTSPDAIERFVLEARAVNQIGHPNIVDVFSFGELADGRSYFVMEQLAGLSLAQRLRKGRLTMGEACEVLEEVVRGLAAAHDKKIVHRDLKPDNVFLAEVRGEKPAVKLLDFGIAKLTGEEGQRVERTRTGAMIGTPQYIAPEQARGYAIDHRADLYSLGVMAFEMFTGRIPFEADNAMDMVSKHLHVTPPAPSTIAVLPPELDALITEMLAKEPADRPSLARIREVLAEVRRAQPGRPDLLGTVPEASLPAGVLAVRKKRRGLALALGGAVVACAAAVGVVVIGGGRDGASSGEREAQPAVTPAVVPDAAAAVVAVDAGVAVVAVDAGVAPVATSVDAGTTTADGEAATAGDAKSTTKRSRTRPRPSKTKPPATTTTTTTTPPPPPPDDDEGVVDPFAKKKRP